MSKDPQAHAETYDLSHDVVADMEEEEGPALGGQSGRNHTNPRDDETRNLHGAKTLRALRNQGRSSK